MSDLIDGSRLGRRIAATTCRGCGQVVYRGLDASRCALETITDIRPLTALGEVEALRDGRRTYRLRGRELDRRDRWSIPGHPPAPDTLVLPEHRCGHPPPASWLAPAARPAAAPASPEEPAW